jgi:hypothetical protein
MANDFSYIRGNARHNNLLFWGEWAPAIEVQSILGELELSSGKKRAQTKRTFASGIAPERC